MREKEREGSTKRKEGLVYKILIKQMGPYFQVTICSELVDYTIVTLAVGNLKHSLPESVFTYENP